MTNRTNQVMEKILIDTVNKELDVIRSFCQAQFNCDVSSVVAVRMSRAVISSICRINTRTTEGQNEVFSKEAALTLDEALSQLEQLSKQFELRLGIRAENELAWNAWTA